MLEMSASMPTGGIGLGDAAAGAAVAGAGAGTDLTTRSFGSGGFPRQGRRGSCGGGGGGLSIDTLRRKSSCDAPAAQGSAPLARSHRMPLWNPGNGGLGGLKGAGGRPISLPSGIMQRGTRGGDGEPAAAAAAAAADAGIGWVLRSPGAPLDHRRRSQSFADGRSGLARARSDSTHGGVCSTSGRAAMKERGDGSGGGGGASGDEHVGAWVGRSSRGPLASSMMNDEEEEEEEEEEVSPAQTPMASPSNHGTSAAMHRAHGLSSVARRMNRLEIGSPDVDTHAAQVLL